jgi:diadenosine tetraphosphate (Ap4A) HIT family hydrolase
MHSCPFCEKIKQHETLVKNEFAAAFFDATPLSPGHTLVVPRRHESDFFLLTEAEESALWRIVRTVHGQLETQYAPHGYNVGVNIGRAGGQTVEHVHVHLIPRYHGDVDDPRGGIRWIIPAKARYWKK